MISGHRIFIQVDLAGHSKYASESPSDIDFAEARADLAERIKRAAGASGFQRLFWAGDGGVFAIQTEGLRNYDIAVEASERIFSVFKDWTSEDEIRNRLGLRCSCHCINVIWHPVESGYWFANELNQFLKLERVISMPGCISVTDPVHKMLSKSRREGFCSRGRLNLTPQIREIFDKPVLEGSLKTSSDGFFGWLRASGYADRADDSVWGPKDQVKAVVGRACILFASSNPGTSLRVNFTQVGKATEDSATHTATTPRHYDLLNKEEIETIKNLEAEILENSRANTLEDSNKISITSIGQPLSEAPAVEAKYELIRWRRIRAFHMFLSGREETSKRISEVGLSLLDRGLLPTNACCHIVVRLWPASVSDPTILIGQRSNAQKATYHSRCWSVSIEEQMRPNEDIETCVRRGVSEELLGSTTSSAIDVTVVGCILEPKTANIAFVAIADVPMHFKDLVDRWPSAIDHAEHFQLAHINLNAFVYNEIRSKGSMEPAKQAIAGVSSEQRFRENDEWELHPTSAVRLLFALWMQQK